MIWWTWIQEKEKIKRLNYLIFDESQYPYKCPSINENIELNEDFINETYKAWRFLLKNKLIYDLVDMDSRKRENKKIKYRKIK